MRNSATFDLAIDSEYSCREVLGAVGERLVVHGALKQNAVICALPEPRPAKRRGRPRATGARLGTIKELAEDPGRPWVKETVKLDGKETSIQMKSLRAMWPGGCPHRPLKIVIVKCTRGDKEHRAFYSTSPGESRVDVTEEYSERWSAEVTSRDLKQLFGFEDSSARKKESVERMVPFVGMLYSAVIVWYAEDLDHTPFASWVSRPWYRHKRNVSFEDILRAARRALRGLDIFATLGWEPKPPKIYHGPTKPYAAAA